MILTLLFLSTVLHAEPGLCDKALSAERWPSDGLNTPAYEFDFAAFLAARGEAPANFFTRVIRDARRAHGSVNVLDLFGSGFFFEGASAVTGFRKAPLEVRGLEMIRLPPQAFGSAFRPAGWAALDHSLDERGLGNFDLVVMRPLGGWSDWDGFKDERAAFAFIARNVPLGRFHS